MQKRKVKGMSVIECIFFLLSMYLKTVRLTINVFVFTFVFLLPPLPPHLPIAISVLAQCEEGEIDRITNISYLLPTEMM